MKHRKLRADEDKYDPQMEKKCLKTLKDTVWSVHPQATSIFLLEKNLNSNATARWAKRLYVLSA